MAGHHRIFQAYVIQILRGIHQAVLDGGSWETSSMFLPGDDPCKRDAFGATEHELQTVAAYKEALKRIQAKPGSRSSKEEGDETEGPPSGAKGAGGKKK